MRTARFLLVCFAAATAAGTGASQAADSQTARVAYFEATVSKNQEVVTNVHAMVKLGADARLTFAGDEPNAPRLGLVYKAQEKSASDLTATVKASVDDHEVANGTLAFTKDHGASSTLEGGGYSWHVTVEYTTPDQMKRREGRK